MASWQGIQTDVITILKNDTALQAMVEGVYDHVPVGAKLPLVVLGQVQGTPWRTQVMNGMQYRLELRVISDAAGRKTATQIVERVREVLWEMALTDPNQLLIARQVDVLRFDAANRSGQYEAELQFRLFTEEVS